MTGEADTGLPFIISIHAPRGGSDAINITAIITNKRFQSTLPVGGATVDRNTNRAALLFQSTLPVGGATSTRHNFQSKTDISIHAPRGGSDGRALYFRARKLYFNPRSPWGERQQRCTDFSVNLWQKCIFSECFLRKSPGYSGWIFGKPLFLPQKFLRTSREFLGALASHGGRLTISQRISVSSGR